MQVSHQDILDALPQPAMLIGADRRIASLNKAATALFGSRVEGRSYGIVLRQPGLLDAIARVSDGQPESETRVSLRGPDGDNRTFNVRIARLGEVGTSGLLLIFRDLTEFEANLRMRQDFIADVSHELKTPLSAISGFLETIQGPANSDAEMREHFFQMMGAEVNRMVRLVEDLLHLARVERGGSAFRHEPIDLRILVQDVSSERQRDARKAGITLTVSPDMPETVLSGDAMALRQVMQNLILNALSHSSATDVHVGIENLGTRHVSVFVEDNGIGIAAEHIPRLTERFYRIDDHRARSGSAGTGLGLSIVKHIVLAHKGRLEISSTPGQGTRVQVLLPSPPDR